MSIGSISQKIPTIPLNGIDMKNDGGTSNGTLDHPQRVNRAVSNQPSGMSDFDLLDDSKNELPVKKKRRWPWILLVILLVGTVASYYWFRGRTAPLPQAYKTSSITRGNIVQQVTANGQITPVKIVTVGSQVSGMITEIMADYNSRVTNGQIIAQLDPSTYKQSLIQAEADLANANAVLSFAELTHRRALELQEAAAIPRSEFEKAEAELKQAQATVKSREAALNKAMVDLERTTIYSPIDGIVISRAVDVGQTVAASLNAPTLFTIAKDLREMRIEAAVSEADVGGVKQGQSVRFTVDAFPNDTFQGNVSQLRYEPRTNQNVVSYTTIVDLRNDDLRLRPGMTANASIVTAERENVLRIPNSALRFQPPESSIPASGIASTGIGRPSGTKAAAAPAASSHPSKEQQQKGNLTRGSGANDSGVQTGTVYLADDKGATLKAVSIKLGASDGSWTEVLEGLVEGDLVATGIIQASNKASAPQSGSNPFGGGGMRPR